MDSKLKIVLCCGDAANQMALANKVAQQFNLAGIVIEKRKKPVLTFKKLILKVIDRFFFNEINIAWFEMLNFYKKQFPSYPETKILETENINRSQVKNFIQEINPDIIMVSGTSLIKNELLKLKPSIGILNLHTGLSPYIKGGPNCTNWCIANNEFHLIGNSIMWIDKGIDSGNLITTKHVDFDGSENLSAIHIKVMEAAHNIYLNVLKQAELDSSHLPNIKQKDIGFGKTYFNRMWNSEAKKNLIKNLEKNNWKETILSAEYLRKKSELKTVELPT